MNNINKEDKIKEVIINLAKMLHGWGIDNENWLISNRLFFKNYNNVISDKYNQFHVLINSLVIPWQVSNKTDNIIPPDEKEFLADYLTFIKDYAAVELYAVTDKEFNSLKNNCDRINLNSISYLQLSIYQQLLNEWQKINKSKDGQGVQVKYLYFLKKIREYAVLQNDEHMRGILNKISHDRDINIKLPVKMINPTNLQGQIKFFVHKPETIIVENNDILVTKEINLKLLPYLIRAQAIITQSNNLTSHASIIFREIKMPLIYDIENIYKYFFEGDEIEVDSVNNTIKIIKTAKLDF